MLLCAARSRSVEGSQFSGPPGHSAAIARWQHSSWFISSLVIEKKHLRTGSSSCCSKALIVALANTAGPEGSELASTENQYKIPSRCSVLETLARNLSQGRVAGLTTHNLGLWLISASFTR